ncbi:MAG: hypothetical protein AMK70_13525 [Nitrospira bacterium SG8_35_1]|nr:MAG: hypothetical protein AMK70_13525 [Nitrospira bacterium SG8_35_1]
MREVICEDKKKHQSAIKMTELFGWLQQTLRKTILLSRTCFHMSLLRWKTEEMMQTFVLQQVEYYPIVIDQNRYCQFMIHGLASLLIKCFQPSRW